MEFRFDMEKVAWYIPIQYAIWSIPSGKFNLYGGTRMKLLYVALVIVMAVGCLVSPAMACDPNDGSCGGDDGDDGGCGGGGCPTDGERGDDCCGDDNGGCDDGGCSGGCCGDK